jgi:hypothetical protein
MSKEELKIWLLSICLRAAQGKAIEFDINQFCNNHTVTSIEPDLSELDASIKMLEGNE